MQTPHVVVYGAEVIGPFPSHAAALAWMQAAEPDNVRPGAVRPLKPPPATAPATVRDCAVCKGEQGNENCRYCRGHGVLPRRAARGK